jgi:hypothetical protein
VNTLRHTDSPYRAVNTLRHTDSPYRTVNTLRHTDSPYRTVNTHFLSKVLQFCIIFLLSRNQVTYSFPSHATYMTIGLIFGSRTNHEAPLYVFYSSPDVLPVCSCTNLRHVFTSMWPHNKPEYILYRLAADILCTDWR